jgi:cbb3-type cytochrome oxidase subunit 3
MIHDVLTGAAGMGPRIGLVLFFLLFIAIVVWTYRGGKDRFRYESRLPLEDGTPLNSLNAESADSQRNNP